MTRTIDCRRCCQSVKKERITRAARGERPLAGAAKRGISAISCLLPSLVMRAPDCLDTLFMNLMNSMRRPRSERAGNAWSPPGECSQHAHRRADSGRISAERKEFAHVRQIAK